MESEREGKRFGIHPDVVKLGLVSFLTDVSSEMIFSVFAVFFTTIMGASAALLGLVEGLADLSASSLDYLAGWLSDRYGLRKPWALVGYGFSTLAKIILLVANSLTGLGVFRVIERLGKSFRGPPRDAWLSAVAEKGVRGYSFGVHKALDKSGAVLGPLLAYVLLSWRGNTVGTYQTLFRIAIIPAVLSVILLGFIPEQRGELRKREGLFSAWRTLTPGFKRYLIVAGTFAMAYFSFGFLLLRAYDVGFSVKDIVLLYALFNVAFVIAAPLVGKLGDRLGRTRIVLMSYLIYMAMSLGFAAATTKWQIILLFVLYGIFLSIDEAQSKAFIADMEAERRATAIGAYNFVTGIFYVLASLIAGVLWGVGSEIVFLLAASLSVAAALMLVWLRPANH